MVAPWKQILLAVLLHALAGVGIVKFDFWRVLAPFQPETHTGFVSSPFVADSEILSTVTQPNHRKFRADQPERSLPQDPWQLDTKLRAGAIFWFFALCYPLLALVAVARAYRTHSTATMQGSLPLSFAVSLFLVSALAAFLLPISGWWLGIVVALFLSAERMSDSAPPVVKDKADKEEKDLRDSPLRQRTGQLWFHPPTLLTRWALRGLWLLPAAHALTLVFVFLSGHYHLLVPGQPPNAVTHHFVVRNPNSTCEAGACQSSLVAYSRLLGLPELAVNATAEPALQDPRIQAIVLWNMLVVVAFGWLWHLSYSFVYDATEGEHLPLPVGILLLFGCIPVWFAAFRTVPTLPIAAFTGLLICIDSSISKGIASSARNQREESELLSSSGRLQQLDRLARSGSGSLTAGRRSSVDPLALSPKPSPTKAGSNSFSPFANMATPEGMKVKQDGATTEIEKKTKRSGGLRRRRKVE